MYLERKISGQFCLLSLTKLKCFKIFLKNEDDSQTLKILFLYKIPWWSSETTLRSEIVHAEKETQPEVPKRLSRRVEIILIKMKHLLKEAEHLISPKGKAGQGEGGRGRDRVTHSCFQKKQVPVSRQRAQGWLLWDAAVLGCRELHPLAADGHPHPFLMGTVPPPPANLTPLPSSEDCESPFKLSKGNCFKQTRKIDALHGLSRF